MSKFLGPQHFNAVPGNSPAEWNHWYRTFSNFLNAAGNQDFHKHNTIINPISPVYSHIADASNFQEALETL